jgi:PAS domain S-box-containing protein
MTEAAIPYQKADRTQLQQIIVGLNDGIIIIDPDQSISWANDAALAMHGVSDIDGLGRDVDEYRSRFELRYRNNHIVPAGNYPIDRVVAGEAFSEIIVEVGSPGEPARWTHRLRSLVLSRPDGKPDCLVLVINDETELYSAEERFEKTFAANPAPAIICRLADLRYVKVNMGFMELTGFAEHDLVGRLLYDVDILQAATRRDFAMERPKEGRTIPQMEATLPTASGGTKLVILAGQILDIGDDSCMLFTFADLEPRRNAEDALRNSEERFSKAFKMAPSPMLVITLPEGRTVDVNDAFSAVTGYGREEVIGRTEPELRLWSDETSRQRISEDLRKSGHVHSLELQLRTKTGSIVDYLLSAEKVTIHDEACVLIVMQDITARKQSQQDLMAAIEAVMKDTSWFAQKIVEKLANLAQSQDGDPPLESPELTARERDVVSLIAQGLPDRDIATKLGLSRATVRNHVSAIYSKIRVNRRAAAVVWARERGFNGEQKQPPSRPRRRKAKQSLQISR